MGSSLHTQSTLLSLSFIQCLTPANSPRSFPFHLSQLPKNGKSHQFVPDFTAPLPDFIFPPLPYITFSLPLRCHSSQTVVFRPASSSTIWKPVTCKNSWGAPGWLSWLSVHFSSGHDLMVHEFKPCIRLCCQCRACFGSSVSLTLFPSPAYALFLSQN